MKILVWVALLIMQILPAAATAVNPSETGEVCRTFKDQYTILKEIGHGTHSMVYLCENAQGVLFAVKRYSPTDPYLLEALHDHGIDVGEWVRELAANEWEIGRRVDHPNIVKVHELIVENPVAYVVMEYIVSEELVIFPSLSTGIPLVHQLLGAIEHLLLNDVIIDDLHTGNLLISHGQLMVIDLGGCEIIHDHSRHDLVDHYVDMIESTVRILGGEVTLPALEDCKYLLPKEVREEELSLDHTSAILRWLRALQNALPSPAVKEAICRNKA